MKQIKSFCGNRAEDTDEEVNAWLADKRHAHFDIVDIKFTYHDGYVGVMVVYQIPDRKVAA